MIAINMEDIMTCLQATKSIASEVKDGLLQLEDNDNTLFEEETHYLNN